MSLLLRLSDIELEILLPRQTVLSEMWHADFMTSSKNWMNLWPDFAEQVYGGHRWRYVLEDTYLRAEMYVHRVMSRNNGFPMVVRKMTDDYSGIFPVPRSREFYVLFQDPYYFSWILMYFEPVVGFGSYFVGTYEVSHGEDAIMFLSKEDEDV